MRLTYAAWAPVFIGGDSLQYYQPVYDLMNGRGFTLSLKRSPAYPAMILLIQSAFGTGFGPIAVAQHLLGAGTVALTYGLGRAIFGRSAGAMAAILVAIAGPQMRMEQFLLSEALFTFCYVLGVYLMVLGSRSPRPPLRGPCSPRSGDGQPHVLRAAAWPWVGAGLALGLAILTRPVGQVLLVLFPPLLLFVDRSRASGAPHVRSTLTTVALVLATCALLVVPWMFYNRVVHGAFTTAARGQSLTTFAIVHRPDFSFDDPLVAAVDGDPKKADARGIIQRSIENKIAKPQTDITPLSMHNRIMEETRMSPAQADAVMGELAVRAYASRPTAYVRHVFWDVVALFEGEQYDLRHEWDLWSSRNWRGPVGRLIGPPTPEQEASYGRLVRLDGFYHPAYAAVPLAVLFLLGLAVAALVPAYRPALLVGAAAAGLILASAGTVGPDPRYRIPPDPLINVVAMGGLTAVVIGLLRLTGRGASPLSRWERAGGVRATPLPNGSRMVGSPHPDPLPAGEGIGLQ